MVIAIFGIYTTYTSIQDIQENPIVYAKITDDSIQFTSKEKVLFNDVGDVQFYDNVKLEIVGNGGYHWSNDNYYSGDANVNILKDDEFFLSLYKGKVYINSNNKSFIIVNEKDSSKSYVFNLSTEKKTKQMYYELLEYVH